MQILQEYIKYLLKEGMKSLDDKKFKEFKEILYDYLEELGYEHIAGYMEKIIYENYGKDDKWGERSGRIYLQVNLSNWVIWQGFYIDIFREKFKKEQVIYQFFVTTNNKNIDSLKDFFNQIKKETNKAEVIAQKEAEKLKKWTLRENNVNFNKNWNEFINIVMDWALENDFDIIKHSPTPNNLNQTIHEFKKYFSKEKIDISSITKHKKKDEYTDFYDLINFYISINFYEKTKDVDISLIKESWRGSHLIGERNILYDIIESDSFEEILNWIKMKNKNMMKFGMKVIENTKKTANTRKHSF